MISAHIESIFIPYISTPKTIAAQNLLIPFPISSNMSIHISCQKEIEELNPSHPSVSPRNPSSPAQLYHVVHIQRWFIFSQNHFNLHSSLTFYWATQPPAHSQLHPHLHCVGTFTLSLHLHPKMCIIHSCILSPGCNKSQLFLLLTNIPAHLCYFPH